MGVLQVRTLTGHLKGVHSVAISPNGKRVVSGSADNLVKIWNAETEPAVSYRVSVGPEMRMWCHVSALLGGRGCMYVGKNACFEGGFCRSGWQRESATLKSP